MLCSNKCFNLLIPPPPSFLHFILSAWQWSKDHIIHKVTYVKHCFVTMQTLCSLMHKAVRLVLHMCYGNKIITTMCDIIL